MMLFREAPEWIQQVLRQLSRDGYIYIGRTGVGLSYAFRKAPKHRASPSSFLSLFRVQGALSECYNQGTIKAIEKHAGEHDLGYRILLELIATEGPKWVGYERIVEYIESQAILRALKEELT
jgi:hypothetical protein